MRFAAIYITAFFFFSACSKYEKKGYIQQGGIALTFDDNLIDNWYKFIPFFDSTGIKATFYICKYHLITPDQKNKLLILKNHGHEIAYHTTNHINMVEYIARYNHTIDELLHNEIEEDLKKMKSDGFYPTTFAYPYGAHTGEIDQALLKLYFKSVRALNGSTDYYASLAPLEKNAIFRGFGLDKSSNHSDEVMIKLMRSAKENNSCAIFVAHNINTDSKLSITLDRLKKIATTVKELDLTYYKIAEISQ